MLVVNNLNLHFGERALFDNVSFRVNAQDKVSLVGRNGAGKSTLLKVIKGVQKPDTVNIQVPNGYTIGYLPQDIEVTSDKNVIEETKSALAELNDVKTRLDAAHKEMEERTDYETDSYMDLISLYNDLDHRYQVLGGYSVEEDIEKILKGLGFMQADLQKTMRSLSGGWQMRVELAKILLQKPDLVLLDEPTNHLDIESVTWLETFLKDYPGAVIIISHDKAFLDNLCNRVMDIQFGEIQEYKGNYSTYLTQKAERKLIMENAKKNQDREIARLERNIERFKAKASKASFAQSLVKQLDRMELIEIEEDDIREMKIRFPEVPRSGEIPVKATGITKRYGQKTVFSGQNFEIERGEKIAFVGKNGMGKTTMSRIVAGDLKQDEGEMKLGHNVYLGYYAQHQTETLNPDNTLLKEMEQHAPHDMLPQVRAILGAFLFSGDDVQKKIKVLSGGEKARVAMAKLLLRPINLLILDEPTNHLDMISKGVLKTAIQNFTGTVITVSHDRDFLTGLTDKVFEFTPTGIRQHIGDIYEFLEKKKVENFRQWEEEKQQKQAVRMEKTSDKQTSDGGAIDKKKIESEIKKIEETIHSLEAQIVQAEKKLSDPEQSAALSTDITFLKTYENTKKELELQMKRWEEKSVLIG